MVATVVGVAETVVVAPEIVVVTTELAHTHGEGQQMHMLDED